MKKIALTLILISVFVGKISFGQGNSSNGNSECIQNLVAGFQSCLGANAEIQVMENAISVSVKPNVKNIHACVAEYNRNKRFCASAPTLCVVGISTVTSESE